MAPLLVKVSNSSGTSVDLYMGHGIPIHIPSGDHVIVNHYLDETTDTKIQVNHDVRRYLLMYDGTDKINNNIMINDTLGRNKGVADTLLWAKNEEENLVIEIFEETIKISTFSKNLRVYQLDDELSPKYYKSVVASHKDNGGITITGVEEDVAGDHPKTN